MTNDINLIKIVMMIIKKLKNCKCFRAGDDSKLRELLNPLKEKLKVKFSLARASVRSGQKTIPHRLKHSEVYYILRGQGIMHINREKKRVKKDEVVYIPPNATQWIENCGQGPLQFLCIVDPAWKPDCEQIVRLIRKE